MNNEDHPTAALRSWLQDIPAHSDQTLDRLRRRVAVTPQARPLVRPVLRDWWRRGIIVRGVQRQARGGVLARVAAAIMLLALVAFGMMLIASQSPPTPPVPVPRTASPWPSSSPAAAQMIVVAQDGSGDAITIAEALDLADNGAVILVRPGTYTESITVTDDVEIRGDGVREAVVVEASAEGPMTPLAGFEHRFAIHLDETEAVLRGLTLRGEHSRLVVDGGSPVIENVLFDSIGQAYAGGSIPAQDAANIVGESTATIRDCTFRDGAGIAIVDGASPLIERNVLMGGPHLWGYPGDDTVLRDNVITGVHVRGIGIFGAGMALIEDNEISGAPEAAIEVGWGLASGIDPVIVANVLRDSGTGILIHSGATPTIEDNELLDNSTGISMDFSNARITGNVIRGGRVGVVATSGGTPTVTGNTFERNEVGIEVQTTVKPVIQGNTMCGNGTDVAGATAEGTKGCTTLPSPTTP